MFLLHRIGLMFGTSPIRVAGNGREHTFKMKNMKSVERYISRDKFIEHRIINNHQSTLARDAMYPMECRRLQISGSHSQTNKQIPAINDKMKYRTVHFSPLEVTRIRNPVSFNDHCCVQVRLDGAYAFA